MLPLLNEIDIANAAETTDDLVERFQQIISEYGFASFAFADITKYDVCSFSIDTDKTGWIDFYRENNFILIDPIIDILRKTNSTFTWQEAEENIVGSQKDRMTVAQAASDFGFREGLVIPIHYVSSVGRMRSAVCTLFWREDRAVFGALMQERRSEVEVVASYWARKIIDKIAGKRGVVTKRSDLAYKIDPRNQLTPREIDVLTWASHGKTSAETATILGISTETVNHHLKYAISKLKVANKVQAVAHAIYGNLIQP